MNPGPYFSPVRVCRMMDRWPTPPAPEGWERERWRATARCACIHALTIAAPGEVADCVGSRIGRAKVEAAHRDAGPQLAAYIAAVAHLCRMDQAAEREVKRNPSGSEAEAAPNPPAMR